MKAKTSKKTLKDSIAPTHEGLDSQIERNKRYADALASRNNAKLNSVNHLGFRWKKIFWIVDTRILWILYLNYMIIYISYMLLVAILLEIAYSSSPNIQIINKVRTHSKIPLFLLTNIAYIKQVWIQNLSSSYLEYEVEQKFIGSSNYRLSLTFLQICHFPCIFPS